MTGPRIEPEPETKPVSAMDVIRKTPNQGWIEVIAGSMFSGKSEELIRRLRRAQIAKQKVQIFKPSVDNRYSDDHITSHSAMKIGSDNAASSRALLEAVLADTEVVGIDEAQFFDAELPAVVNTGDKVRVSTETGEYQSRA